MKVEKIMNSLRKTALTAGILFIIGTAAGITGMAMTTPILQSGDIAAHETGWIIGTMFTLVMGLPLAMLPVVLYPVLKKGNEVLALGAVVFRGVLEAVAYVLMVICSLMLLSVANSSAVNSVESQALMQAIRAGSGWIELLLAVVFSIGSWMINHVLFQMRLVPRWLSGWGWIGSVLYFGAALICIISPAHPAFGFESSMGWLIGPLAIQEMVIAVWMIVKGFNPVSLRIGEQG
jgi:hypothetical protein